MNSFVRLFDIVG